MSGGKLYRQGPGGHASMHTGTHFVLMMIPLFAAAVPALMLCFGAAALVERALARTLNAIGAGLLFGTLMVTCIAGLRYLHGLPLDETPALYWLMIFAAAFNLPFWIMLKATFLRERRSGGEGEDRAPAA